MSNLAAFFALNPAFLCQNPARFESPVRPEKNKRGIIAGCR
ncbi:hypothetical protein MCC93_11960 [Morococcus cerebrosus]|uniref:Uncharacterized protein n=1 Tax=Morococcus cerebrosus TaxID=1056807 RepID=A0A0C1GSW6_9NEIS|nr:hypothetical protein MCC93_11960 [Morococcus cerebrosus]